MSHDESSAAGDAPDEVGRTWTGPAVGSGVLSAAERLLSSPVRVSVLNDLSALAADLLGTTSAQVAVLDPTTQRVLGGVGASAPTVGLVSAAVDSLCSLTTGLAAPVAIEDCAADPRVSSLPPVVAGLARAYLGVPLVLDETVVGAICVFDPAPRAWTEADVTMLQRLAGPALSELQLAATSAEHDDERLLWRLAVDAAGVGAFDWDLTSDELRWDDRLLEVFGLDDSTFGGTIEAFNAAVHPDDLLRVSQALTHAMETCGEYEAEYRILLPDGTTRWVFARGHAVRGPAGAAVRLVGAAYDTTAVQDGETRVSRVLESMSTAFFQLDTEWRFTYLNTEAQRLLGGIGSDIVGHVVWELFPESVGSDFETYYRRAARTGQPVEFEAYYPPPLDRWYEVRAWPAPDGLWVYFLDITARRHAQAVADRAGERTRLLSAITEALIDTLDTEEVAARLALAAGAWADWSLVTLVDPDADLSVQTEPRPGDRTWRRGLHDVAGQHSDPALQPVVDQYRQLRIPALIDDAFLFRALRERHPIVVREHATDAIANVLEPGPARDVLLQLAPASMIVLPLQGRDRTLGLLTIFRDAGHPFSDDDVDDLIDAAARGGLALDNARLYAGQRELAEGLQRSLLTAPPELDHLHVVVRYEPAAEAAQVGGDWYDAFLQQDGATNVVIGDVMGHDTAAAAAMGQIRGLLRGIAVTTGESPAQVLTRVDHAMSLLRIDTTVTAVAARLEQTPDDEAAGTTTMRWSSAGHPPPLVAIHPESPLTPETTGASLPLDPADVQVDALWEQAHHMLLGIDPSARRTDAAVSLPRGSTVLLYTDGLVERRGQDVVDGVELLRGVVAELVAQQVGLDDLCDEVLRRMLPEFPEDDVALVAIRLHPEDRPRPPEAGPTVLPDALD